MSARRILLAGGSEATRDRLREALGILGLDGAEEVPGLGNADWSGAPFDLVLVCGDAQAREISGDLELGEAVAAARSRAPSSAVLAVVGEAPREGLRSELASAGADDLVVLPAETEALAARLQVGVALGLSRREAAQLRSWGAALAVLGEALGALEGPEDLHEYLQRLAESTNWVRPVVLVTTRDPRRMLLVAAADEPGPFKIPLDIERYPEVRACLAHGVPVLIEDTRRSETMGAWAELACERGGPSLYVAPLLGASGPTGVLLLRGRVASPPVTPGLLEYLALNAGLLGAAMSHPRILEATREQTERVSIVGYEEERRLRALDKHRDFFESASDGVFVVDEDGLILYVNRAAEQISGYSRRGLQGRPVTDIVPAAHREPLVMMIRRVLAGEIVEWFDLQLSTTSGERLTVSVSSSAALVEHGAVVLSFRDVTEARALETELRKTKDFLERLIDSTVDGIIAADMRGEILIFNQGAARLFGYSPDEVIGHPFVERLYPEGVARQIMAELRAGEHGGVGRLEPTRRHILSRTGELVPVSLTASIVYERGREVASVGVLSDLRDRLRIEQRLQQAQEKLVVSEKQALIAELAGTTAHELNQPLTSIMGYAELLRRKMSPQDAHYRAIDIIFREAERMAEIVRKIGRITHYETKEYVGSTTILDLDKSSS